MDILGTDIYEFPISGKLTLIKGTKIKDFAIKKSLGNHLTIERIGTNDPIPRIEGTEKSSFGL